MRFIAEINNRINVWLLAGPLILSNISVALLGIVDTAVVGHLDAPYYLGAVAVGSVVFDFLYWGMGFLRMGTTGVVAQVNGRGDNDELRVALFHGIIVALMIALILLVLQRPVIDAGLYLIGGSEQVKEYADVYISWAIWGAPAVLVSMVMLGWMLGVHNARATLVVSVCVNLLNILLDVYLVFGLDMGVRGVALASVISQYSGMLVALVYVKRELNHRSGKWDKNRLTDLNRVSEFLALNHNIFIRTICLILAFAFFTRQGARQGDIVLAANAVLLNFQAVTALGLDGFANAAEALVGKAIGAGNRQLFRDSVKVTVIWSIIIAVLFSLTYALLGKQFIYIMTSIDTVRSISSMYLPWMIVSPLICVWCFLLDGIFIGATRSREMRNSMLVSTFMVFVPAWYLLQGLGNHGLWLAFMIFFTARGLTLGAAALQIEYACGFVREIDRSH